jgi:hypothetical protein
MVSTISYQNQSDEESVVVDDTIGNGFKCEEEPHMLPALTVGGYFPLQLGHKLKSENTGIEYEIVGKLGWGVGSSVWLCNSRCV